MKKYTVGAGGREFVLAGLVDSVKVAISDIVQAQERVRLHRQNAAGLLPPEVFASEQQAVQGIGFASYPTLAYIATDVGARRLIREMMVAAGNLKPDDEDVELVRLATQVPGSEAAAVSKQIWEDGFPKVQTPPTSTAPANG